MVHIIPRDKVRHLEWKPGQEVPPGPDFSKPVIPTPPIGITGSDFNFTIDDILKGKIFKSEKKDESGNYIGLAVALKEALEYANTVNGFIATMPELIAAKLKASVDHDFWENGCDVHTEENIGIDKKGRFYTKDEPVLVVVNGGGILTPPRIFKAYEDGLIDNSARYSDQEFDDLLDGKLADGTSIQLHKFEDIKNGISDLPHRFGVVMPYSMAQNTESGYFNKTDFMNNPLVIARAAELENLEAYFERAKDTDDDTLGNHHPFNGRDASTPQGRVLVLYNYCIGLIGNCNLGYIGRFVVVAPEALDAKK